MSDDQDEQFLLVAINEFGDETAFLRFRASDPKWSITEFAEVINEWAGNNANRTITVRTGIPFE